MRLGAQQILDAVKIGDSVNYTEQSQAAITEARDLAFAETWTEIASLLEAAIPLGLPAEALEPPAEPVIQTGRVTYALTEPAPAEPLAPGTLVYASTIDLPAEVSLQTAVEIEAYLQGKGLARLDAAAGTITFEVVAADLWDACAEAHEIQTEMQSHGIESEVDRDCLLVVE